MRSHDFFRCAALLLCALNSSLAGEFNQVQVERSQLAFSSRQMGVPVEGKFKTFSVRLAFDPAKPEAAQARIEIDLSSVDAGSSEANAEVVGKNWFDVKDFPSALFVASGVKDLGGGRYQVTGNMSIKGRTRPLSAPFSFRQEGDLGIFEGAFTLQRLQWGIGEGPWSDVDTVADEVQVRFRFVARSGAERKSDNQGSTK